MDGQLDELLASLAVRPLPCLFTCTVFALLYFVYCTVTNKYN